MIARVLRDYRTQYPDPIAIAVGETVVLSGAALTTELDVEPAHQFVIEAAGSVGGALAIGGRRRACQDDELVAAGKRCRQAIAAAVEKNCEN